MDYEVRAFDRDEQTIEQAASILFEAFAGMGKDAWPTIESAKKEVTECLEIPSIAIGIFVGGRMLGWVGIRPMYEKVWELHPLVVGSAEQRKGLGKILVGHIETIARENGIEGLVLGTDDETQGTSLSQRRITRENILEEIAGIKNLRRHPYGFYEKQGYFICGVIPNANGSNKPDIWMYKDLRK